MKKIINLIIDWYKNLSGEKKKQAAIFCTAGFCVLLTLSVIVSMVNSGNEKPPVEPETIRFNVAIPAEELFIPDEPDFLPGVLLERDRRESWNEQDALEFWQNPLVSGEEKWREKIETAINEILERVP